MKSILTLVYDSLRANLGKPVHLDRLLAAHPEAVANISEPKLSIDARRVVQWHDWADRIKYMQHSYQKNHVVGWQYNNGRYESMTIGIVALSQLGQCHVTEHWACDIQDVSGLLASKSILSDFRSMDDMVKRNSPEMIPEITESRLRANLAHSEIRIVHDAKTFDHFTRYAWDGRVFLMNSGGSHHFAAARYIASRIGQSVPLQGKLKTYFISEAAVNALRREYEILVIANTPTISNAFHKAMAEFKATYIPLVMPEAYDHATAILLPRHNVRSTEIAAQLKQFGGFDLGQHLTQLCKRQQNLQAA